MLDRIDKLDRKILNIIMKNARIASKDVAAVCGVSRAAIHQRIQRLIEMKVIVGSGYNDNPRRHGYNTGTYVGVKLEKGSLYREVVISTSWNCSTTASSTSPVSPKRRP